MRTIKVNQIKSVLEECSRLSKDKVYSVLFVSELDDYVKKMIEEWLAEQKKKGLTYSFRNLQLSIKLLSFWCSPLHHMFRLKHFSKEN